MIKTINRIFTTILSGLCLFFFAIEINSQTLDGSAIYGDFPYFRSLQDNNGSGLKFPATANGRTTNSAKLVNGLGLRLTENKNSQFGACFLEDCLFSSINGIRLEFEYMIYGGSGADGFVVFLSDAVALSATPTVGTAGSSLGYTYNRASNYGSNENNRCDGLSGAYLGIGFDVFGNFKYTRWAHNERKGGTEKAPNNYNGEHGSHITIRGGIGPGYSKGGMGTPRTSGYPVLVTQSTSNKAENKILNSSGNYVGIANSPSVSNFSLRGGTNFSGTSSSGYRKAIIELYPIPADIPSDPPKGMYITVKIKTESGAYCIIEDYEYINELKYKETAAPKDSDYNNSNTGPYTSEVLTLNAKAPQYMRIGFTASTGGKNDNHVIKNLLITLPCSAEAYDDYGENKSGQKVMIKPLENDKAYTGTVSRDNIGKPEYVDPESFWFIDPSTGQPAVDQHKVYTTNGRWDYNKNRGEVSFLPNKGFVGEEKVEYTIKGGINGDAPYNDEAYRSPAATITARVTPRKGLVSNKMISSVFK